MIKTTEKGKVINRENGEVEILLESSSLCMRCQKCKKGRGGKSHLMVQDSLGCQEGQRVEIQIVTPNQLKGIILLYGLPLIVFISVNIIVYLTLAKLKFNPDLSAVISVSSAILLTGTTYYIISKWCKKRVKAEVIKILS